MTSDLYFMLNPALATVKIGIATDVEARRVQLEHACGVPLVIVGVLAGGGQYEKDLHDAFDAQRLIGEWFSPSDDLIGLAESPAGVSAFILASSSAIAAARTRRGERRERRRVERDEVDRPHREELARLAVETKRVEREREAAKKRRADAAAKRERARLDEERREVEIQRAAFANKSPALRDRVIRADAIMATEQRRAALLRGQRARNASMLGISPEAASNG